MIRKIVGIAVCLAAIITRAGAQELGIELDGGLQGAQYRLQNGQVTQLPAASLGLDYTFRLSSRWDLLTGIIGGLYRTHASLLDGTVFTYDEVDDAGSAFQYNVKTTGYKETQQFIAVNIPLMLQYHTTGAGMRWYFDAGGKAFFPLNAGIRISADQLSLSGYYPDYNLNISNLPQHGFGTINGLKASPIVALKSGAALSAATGLSFRLSPGTRLYMGLYIDYGLTGLKAKNDSMPLVTYSSAGISKVQANSVLNMPIAGQMNLLSFGIQARLSFGSARAKPAARPKTQERPRQLPDSTLSRAEVETLRTPVIFGLIGEAFLSENEKAHLDKVADIMQQHPGIRISIVGHTCDSAVQRENVKVAEARAQTVAHYLRGKGISRTRMDISYFPESDPFHPDNPAANYRNRRAVITIE